MRTLTQDEIHELSELWGISRTALAISPNKTNYDRKLWVTKQFAKRHPDLSETAVYKLMERNGIGDFYMRNPKKATKHKSVKKPRTPAQKAARKARNTKPGYYPNPSTAVPRKPTGIGDYMKQRRKSLRHMSNATRTESYMAGKFKYQVQVLRTGKWITLARFETKAMALEYGRSKQHQYPSKTFQINW